MVFIVDNNKRRLTLQRLKNRAGDGIRIRDNLLGRLAREKLLTAC